MTAHRASMTMITLGVSDLPRSRRFYASLGWKDTPASQESVAFLQGSNILLGLFGSKDLAKDAHLSVSGSGYGNMTIAANQTSRKAVDHYYSDAIEAGAQALKEPGETFWGGYSGYFADPDGHVWEVAHNPFFPMDDEGRVNLLGEKAA
ncbi:MAG: VOC family protein [Rhizobiaceae bacterium]